MAEMKDPAACRTCGYWGADIRINGCGCHVHARCLPRAFMNNNGGDGKGQPCPCCNTPVTSLYLKPLCFHDLEDSVRLRKADAMKKNKNKPYDDNDADIEARYLVFSQGRNTVSSTLTDTDNARTGRWTEEEVAFVDHLVQAFDKGELPLPHGVKLSTFLGDILLCKASRLTKKMKNAKLSTRSFEVTQKSISVPAKEDRQVFSALQDRFISSMPTKIAQLELKFNLVKQWRAYFSNLCIQVGFQGLDANDWISSVEEIERRASKTEEQMRIVRRKRMGLCGGRSTEHQRPLKQARSEPILQEIAAKPMATSSSLSAFGTNAVVSGSSSPSLSIHQRTFSDDLDLDNAILSLYDSQGGQNFHSSFEEDKGAPLAVPKAPSSSNDFLEAISRFMENRELPFQHADVWVPSFAQGTGDQVQLLHAGHATRRDQGGVVLDTLKNFGEFSKDFKFHPNQGLPGRVYAAGEAQWEFQLSNPSVFPRYKAAKAYGLRTATAIPISTPGVGRMVVVFYSSSKLMEDQSLVSRCARELASYAPTPKWKLVIEIGNYRPNKAALTQGHNHPPTITEEPTTTTSSEEKAGETLVVDQMVSLLGNELASASSANHPSPQDMNSRMMGMRLLLLKSPNSRSANENELVGILEGSYKAYAKDNKRSQSELARLLVTEYICLHTMNCGGGSNNSNNALLPGGSPSQQTTPLLQTTPMPDQPLLPQQQQLPLPVQKQQEEDTPVVPLKVYSRTQLARAALPPMFGRGISGPPTRLQSVLFQSNMSRTVSFSGITTTQPAAAAAGNFSVPDSAFDEQPPSF
eukprot:CAMPEP_0113624246 /NCGR_PEP_ID=MMETSP0017_2-20120614/12494_1 /TAXON_ID=2856 /ORGANISM="Cylindrotheca closterium" /LENGTH=804 /DNA_ID=CAMNT_0000534261 /DNA_START=229 /DNA_END=2643 /DNA_ORIENTATION=- /assembly_acc=CAM_ASM_000147